MRHLIQRLEEAIGHDRRTLDLLRDLVGRRTSDAAYAAADDLVKKGLVQKPSGRTISWSTQASGSGYRLTKKGRTVLKRGTRK